MTTAGGALRPAWTPASPAAFTSFRADFDARATARPWRGAVTVHVTGPGGTRTAYTERTGTNSVNPSYKSVLVPLPAAASGDNTVTGAGATITLTRQAGSPWPDIMRIVAATADPPMIANGNAGATSSATALTAALRRMRELQPTYRGYYPGKLTDEHALRHLGLERGHGLERRKRPVHRHHQPRQARAVGLPPKLITHEDRRGRLADDVPAPSAPAAPRETQRPRGRQKLPPTGTSGQATLASTW